MGAAYETWNLFEEMNYRNRLREEGFQLLDTNEDGYGYMEMYYHYGKPTFEST